MQGQAAAAQGARLLLRVPVLDRIYGVPGRLEHIQLRLPGEVRRSRGQARLEAEGRGPASKSEKFFNLIQTCAEKRTVLISTSLAWPAVAGSQLSAISFAQPCTSLSRSKVNKYCMCA